MMAGAGVAAAPAAAPEAAEEEEEAPQAVQTSFTIKMEKYDASKKVQKFTLHCWRMNLTEQKDTDKISTFLQIVFYSTQY